MSSLATDVPTRTLVLRLTPPWQWHFPNGHPGFGLAIAHLGRPRVVDNQAIVIPETIDAIRALAGLEPNGSTSIRKTNASLGICGQL